MTPLSIAKTGLIALLSTAWAGAAQSPGTGLDGRWSPRDRSVVINFAPCGTALCGTVVEGVLKPSTSDLRGKIVIRDLVRQPSGIWLGRYVGDGNNLAAKLKLNGTDQLDVKVCMVSFLCNTQIMFRAR
jgi:uncharacterized protein (DUF2147 family)